MPPGTAPLLHYLPTPSTSPQYQSNAGGQGGGQVRVGSGLCQGSAGDLEGLLQGGEARHKLGVGSGGRWHL